MPIIEIKDLIKSYGERTILDIEDLKIYENKKIGVVGDNGSGKTTFFNLLTGNEKPDKGIIKVISDFTYIEQFEKIDDSLSYLSGGEKTKLVLNTKLNLKTPLLFLDEPTNNLDITERQKLEDILKQYKGTLFLISHDRNLLDNLCDCILEIENSKIKLYNGNYSAYKTQKEQVIARIKFEYNEYRTEKKRLENSIGQSKKASKSVKKTPSRMGNSEARLHKRESTEIVEKLEGHTKALEKRLSKLEEKENYKDKQILYMDMSNFQKIKSKYIANIMGLNIKFDNKIIFDNTSFIIKSNCKTAIIGGNGAGKTTLIKRIVNSDININPSIKIAYFSQEFEDFNDNETAFDYVSKTSIQNDIIVRNILGRLLFKADDVFKKIEVLSGGEKVKLAFAKMLVSSANLLILDEPTNFLDLNSLEALEELLSEYQGTVLFTSHDRHFIDKIATDLLIIANKKVTSFEGNYTSYLKYRQEKPKTNTDKMVIEMKLIALSSKIATTTKLDERNQLEEEYQRLLKELNN